MSENENVNLNEENKKIEELKDDSWFCIKCGEKNVGNFCCKCGEKKPEDVNINVKETKNEKHNKIITLPRIITLVLAILLGLGSGYIGGLVAGKQLNNDEKINMNNTYKDDDIDPGFLIPDENEDDNQDSNSSIPFAKAAIGIYVQQDESVGYSGCIISGFKEDSNAQSSGLQEGDIISKIDNKDMSSYADIQSALADKNAGDTISITVIRNSKEVTVNVELVNSGTIG